MFRDLRRLFSGVPASLAGSSGIFLGGKTHFDLVRAGSALFGINPTQGAINPMLPVVELKARIVQVREFAVSPHSVTNRLGATNGPKNGLVLRNGSGGKQRRVALVSVGYADGYPAPASHAGPPLEVIIRGERCPVAAAPSMDFVPIDVTDLRDRSVARLGTTVTLIGDGIEVDDVAAASGLTGREVLSRLGRRFHRIYCAT